VPALASSGTARGISLWVRVAAAPYTDGSRHERADDGGRRRGLEPDDELVVAEDERRPLRPRPAGALAGAGRGQPRRNVAAALA
jgi:hypothetical protein